MARTVLKASSPEVPVIRFRREGGGHMVLVLLLAGSEVSVSAPASSILWMKQEIEECLREFNAVRSSAEWAGPSREVG